MILLRIALLSIAFSSSVYSMDGYVSRNQTVYSIKDPQFLKWYKQFSKAQSDGCVYGIREQDQLAIFYAAKLAEGERLEKIAQENREIAQQQLQATKEQNALMVRLLDKLSANQPQAPAAQALGAPAAASAHSSAAAASSNPAPSDCKDATK